MFFLINLTITIYKCFTNRSKYSIIVDMNEDELVMIEIQSKMVEMLIEYQEHGLQALAMAMKTILDTYVVALGEEDTVKLLETAIKTVKEGKHSNILNTIPKNQLN